MVDEQIARRGVTDPRVLDAMRTVERHLFVPHAAIPDAYDDRPLAIGEGQTISQPYMVAVMTEALNAAPRHVVLEIGTGSGYQTAILARLAGEVISIERHARLAERARHTLAAQGFTTVEVIVGDGTAGYPTRAPYDRILVTAAARTIPAALQEQLAPDGRLVMPVGPPEVQHVTIVTRTAAGFTTDRGDACVFVPLVGSHG